MTSRTGKFLRLIFHPEAPQLEKIFKSYSTGSWFQLAIPGSPKGGTTTVRVNEIVSPAPTGPGVEVELEIKVEEVN